MHWQIRWAKNALLGVLPFAEKLRRWKRRWRPYPSDFPEFTLEEGLRLTELLKRAGCQIRGAQVLEIGSGWQPIIPLLFSAAGAARVVMTDSQRLMDEGTFRQTAENMAIRAPPIAARLGLSENVVRLALAEPPLSFAELLARYRLEYFAPCDIASAELPERAFDIVLSRAVLEHVPPTALRSLLARTRRLLRPGGWTCHAVDNSDHYSHWDSRLSRVNFLRYSDRTFEWLNRFNRLDYQNRLRHPEYIQLLSAAGLEIVIAHSDAEPKALAELGSMPVAPRFRRFAAEDLARLDSYFVARRALEPPTSLPESTK